MYHSGSSSYSNLQHDSLLNSSAGLTSKSSSYIDSTSSGGGQLKSASNYSADSLSRSYFDSAMALKGYNDHHQQRGSSTSVGGSYDSSSGMKSFTPESGRTSSDSPDHTKSSSVMNNLNQQHQNQHGIQHHQATGMAT